MIDGRRFTRRDVLSGAAVAGAGALLGPAVARGAAGGSGARLAPGAGGAGDAVFDHAVGTVGAGTAPVISPRRRFTLVAVRWSTPAHARIELRARRADGRWGPWGLASSDGHDGDGVVPGDHVGEGIWTGPGTEVQLRSAGIAHGVRLQFVAAESAGAVGAGGPRSDKRGPTDPIYRNRVGGAETAETAGAPALATPTLPAGPGQPPIIARGVWAGAAHPPRHGPLYGAIEMGVVHHTENPNGYSAAEVPALLRAIYTFHVFGRGWWDIGYNYLVDRFGRIWEGRAGGIDLPVVGAQAGDWNTISFGVAMLGTFTDVVPSPAAIGAVERLLAWKMALNGLPAIGEIAAVVQAEAVSWTQFRTGEHVHFPRIAGHRDVDSTDCPGGALYGRLPAMRPRIARLAGPLAQLTLAAELDELVTGPVLALRGRLTHAGRPLAAATVEIQAVGQATPLTTVTTGADGRWATTLVPRRTMALRALHPTAPAVVSPLLQVSRGTSSPPLVQ